MVEAGILLTFALVLLAGIVLGAPLLPLLVFGMLLFASYGLWRGFSAREVARMAASGLKSVGSVLTLFVLIGALTASWRAAGTIPAITCWSATLVSPRNLVLLSFLLTSGMSMLVGSSYAAAATVGVICMTIATAMKADVALVGGAILAGAFVGDRCSPMSSSAALVASITKTQVFDNVRRMVRTGAVPFALCCVVYGIAGMTSSGSAMRPSFAGSFASSFDLLVRPRLGRDRAHRPHPRAVAPEGERQEDHGREPGGRTSRLRLRAAHKRRGAAGHPRVWLQVQEHGHRAHGQRRRRNLLVGVASTYSGIFRETGLLLGLRDYVDKVARHSTPFVSVLLTSIATCVIACDQVVALMLTCQLCEGTERDGSALALDLENSAAVIPSVIPWSTSCVGIVAFVGMPMTSILWNCLSVLIPLWTLAISMYQHSHAGFSDTHTARLLGLDRRDDARRLAAAA